MSESDLLLGLGPTRPTPSAAASAEFAGLYRLSAKVHGDNSQFVIDCKDKLNPGRFVLSAGRRRALVSSNDGEAVFFLDFDRFACQRVALPGLERIRVLGWGEQDQSLLYATVLDARFSDVPAVFELELVKGHRRLIGAPVAQAAYTKHGAIAVPGSRSLNPALYKLKPDHLVPAQVGIIDEAAAETRVFPLGLWTSAALLAGATMSYSSSADALAIGILVPTENKSTFASMVSFSLENGAVHPIAGTQVDRMPLYSWAPTGSRLAVCDCTAKNGSLIVVEAPVG